jgi:hypothetical protein
METLACNKSSTLNIIIFHIPVPPRYMKTFDFDNQDDQEIHLNQSYQYWSNWIDEIDTIDDFQILRIIGIDDKIDGH